MNWQDKYEGFLLAEGSYGQIYQVHADGQPLDLVVKVLRSDYSDPQDRRRMLREINCLLSLKDNEYVIEVLDYDTTADLPWFVMLKADNNLSKYVGEKGGLSEEECLCITRCILDALEDAHNKGILHRDLGASNILLFKEEHGYRIQVADFSLGRDFSRQTKQLTRTLQAHLGQDAFVAPEQILNLNQATNQSDIFAVGSLMSFMLTGQDPRLFQPDSPLDSIIRQFRDRDPQRRPQTVAEAKRLLDLYEALNNRETRMGLDEIAQQFHQSMKHPLDEGVLSKEALHDLTSFVTRQNQLFEGSNQGDLTFNRYFQHIITIPKKLFEYWITHSTDRDIERFLDRFFEQVHVIRKQTRWTFRNMKKIIDVLMVVFDMHDGMKARIFELFVIVWDSGFGEAYESIVKVMTQEYHEQRTIVDLSLIMSRYQDLLESVYRDNAYRIRHASFASIFEGF